MHQKEVIQGTSLAPDHAMRVLTKSCLLDARVNPVDNRTHFAT